MLKFFATEVTVSKGANGTPALKYSEKGDFVRFRIGTKVYYARDDKNHGCVNLTVKAFGTLCERIRKMDLKEGSHINLCGRSDEHVWEDETNTKKSILIMILITMITIMIMMTKMTISCETIISQLIFYNQTNTAKPSVK